MTRRLILILFIPFTIFSCNSQDCEKLTGSFASYEQAISEIEKCNFKIEETANTSNSSWITAAKYYSCDGNKGYLIYNTKSGREYIHEGVPANIWGNFKNATSKGSYYNQNIKNRYQLKLN